MKKELKNKVVDKAIDFISNPPKCNYQRQADAVIKGLKQIRHKYKKYYYNKGVRICDIWVNPSTWSKDVKMGGSACKNGCPHCMGFDDEEKWIKCEKLDEALNI